MMLPLNDILNKYNIHPNGVIHCGSHWAEEHEEYLSIGVERFVYVEPCEDAFQKMWQNVNRFHGALKCMGGIYPQEYNEVTLFDNSFDRKVRMFKLACGAEEKTIPMYVSHQNQGQSNSLLQPELHLYQHPEIVFNDAEIVTVIPLDNLPLERELYSMLVMDVQGYEGEVLKGATETLKHIDIIYTEVNRGQTYKGNMEIDEVDELLSDFERVETYWPSTNWTWGDAVYIRKKS